jgi:hypothetical protein
VTGRELQQIFAEAAQQPDHPYVDTITVGEDLHLVLPAGQPNHYGNHSCDPNLWWADAYILVARRPIAAGEEVTSDYATSTGVADFTMDCACLLVRIPLNTVKPSADMGGTGTSRSVLFIGWLPMWAGCHVP